MKSVKKLDPKTELYRKLLSEDKSFVVATKGSTTFAVVDESGSVMKSSTGQYEIYRQKNTAQLVANHYNTSSALNG